MKNTELKKEEINELSKEQLVDTVVSLQTSVNELLRKNEVLMEALQANNQRMFGRKSEVNQNQLNLDLFFNEAEALQNDEITEVTLKEAAPKRIKTKGKKAADLSKITEHRDEYVGISTEELNLHFGEGNYKRLPDQIIEKLEHKPAVFEAVTYHIAVYAARNEEKAKSSILRAKGPTELFPKSVCTPSLLAGILFAKYVNYVPLYRQEKIYEDNNIFINRTSMANWIIKAYDSYLQPVYSRMKEELLKSDIIHADETTVRCSEECKGQKRSKNYMWVYQTCENSDAHKVVLYEYQRDRRANHPEEFLDGYHGTVVCDGYSGYHNLESVNIAGCWVHAKRKYAEYVKMLGDKARGTLAYEGMNRISNLFHIEHKIKDLPAEEHLKKRQELLKPLVDEYFSWVSDNIGNVPEKSETGKAFRYSLNQEKYLRTFLEDANIPLENNAAERSIRPFTINRKNFVMIDSVKGAKASAAIHSIVETARLNNLKLYDYIKYLLEELPKYCTGISSDIPESLMPWSAELPSCIFKDSR